MVLAGFKFVFLHVVFFGLFQIIKNIFNIKNDYLPFVGLIGIGVYLFLSGLLNVMPESVALLAFVSLSGIVYYLSVGKIRNICSGGIIFFMLGSIICVVLLRGSHFYMYDDFSHWGLVAREIILYDRFPNYTNDIITFQSYPTGSAAFIYFVGKIVGKSEGVMLMAQAMLYLSCISPFFSLLSKNKKKNFLIIILYSLVLFIWNSGMRTLYVDTLLTSVTLAVVVTIADSYLDNRIEEAFLPVLLGSSFLVSVKNSGLLFSMILVLFFTTALIKRNAGKKLLYTFVSFASPWITRTLWNKHAEMVYPNAKESKHSMSLANYQNVREGKTAEEISEITNLLIERSTSVDFSDVKYVFLIALFLVLVIIIKLIMNIKRKENKYKITEYKILSLIIGTYIIYQIGLWATYVFSMPIREAIGLASYTRYNITMSALLIGFFVVFYYIELKKKTLGLEKIYQFFLIFLLSFSLVNLNGAVKSIVSNSGFQDSPRNQTLQILTQNEIDFEAKQAVYVSDLTMDYKRDFLYYQLKYDLRTTNFEIFDVQQVEKLSQIDKSEKANLFVLKSDYQIDQLIKENEFENSEIKIFTN